MKTFISWSGERSKAVANLLNEWLKCVVQQVEPWISTEMNRGSLWFTEILGELKCSASCIVCVTPENKDRPWLLFEAGALACGLTAGNVCTLLIDLEEKDIQHPLAEFNATLPNREGMLALVKTLNNRTARPLDEKRLTKVFDASWDDFEGPYQEAVKMKTVHIKPAKREDSDILADILETTRDISRRLAGVEGIKTLEVSVDPTPLTKISQRPLTAVEKFTYQLVSYCKENSVWPTSLSTSQFNQALGFSESALIDESVRADIIMRATSLFRYATPRAREETGNSNT